MKKIEMFSQKVLKFFEQLFIFTYNRLGFILCIAFICFIFSFSTFYVNKENEKLKSQSIENIKNNISQKLKKSEQLKVQKEEIQKNIETLIWESRCLKQNVNLQLENLQEEDCTKNLERFAIYNTESK